MKNHPDNPLYQQIYHTLQSKSTPELVVIWEENDRTAWSPEAFAVIHDILSERLEKVPAQKEPVYEKDEAQDEEDSLNTYHIPSRLFRIIEWSRNLSWIVLVTTAIAGLVVVNHRLPVWLSYGFEGSGPFGSPLVAEGAAVAVGVSGGLVSFVVLQAIAEIVYILMDIEENTRPKF